MTYSHSCSIPSPNEVLEQPLTLFINSVVSCDKFLFERIDKSNYKSFIAAELAATKRAKSIEALAEIKASTMLLVHRMTSNSITMNKEEHSSLDELLSLPLCVPVEAMDLHIEQLKQQYAK